MPTAHFILKGKPEELLFVVVEATLNLSSKRDRTIELTVEGTRLRLVVVTHFVRRSRKRASERARGRPVLAVKLSGGSQSLLMKPTARRNRDHAENLQSDTLPLFGDCVQVN